MTIIPLAKLTLFGLSADRKPLLDGLQSLGCLHLIPLTSTTEDENFVRLTAQRRRPQGPALSDGCAAAAPSDTGGCHV